MSGQIRQTAWRRIVPLVVALLLIIAPTGQMRAQSAPQAPADLAANQEFSSIARVLPRKSGLRAPLMGPARLRLALSQGVPYRVFTLDNPRRLIVDFRQVDFSGVDPQSMLPRRGPFSDLRFGVFAPGWSRLVADLDAPLLPRKIGMPIDADNGQAVLEISFENVSAEAFAAAAGPPAGIDWMPEPRRAAVSIDPERFVIVIDPGHGGVDPGAIRDGLAEKDLTLTIALALRDELRRFGGVEALLTREQDRFVSLPARVTFAHQAGADLFISLHADALSEGQARGATVYTLSDEASDEASAQLAAQHDRADILAGIDLTGTDDEVASVLLDLARVETDARSDLLAGVLIDNMRAAGGPINSRPHRSAGFSVLKSADIPSVLVEIGFLSDPRDLANLRDPVWRAAMVRALSEGVLAWRDADAVRAPLLRR